MKTAKDKLEERLRKLQQDHARYSKDPNRYIFEIAHTVDRIARLLSRVRNRRKREDLERWVEEERHKGNERVLALRERFGKELARRLREVGLTLTGHSPRLRVPPFTLVVNFGTGTARVLYGPEILKRSVRLDPERVVRALLRSKNDLESPSFDPEALLKLLREAHTRALGQTAEVPNSRARIVDVLDQMRSLSSKAPEGPLRDRLKDYDRARFAFDLHRLLRSGIPTRGLRLVVATLDQTESPKDFLWVQTRPSGEGTAFSSIEFVEDS
jgi:hypothetical protein